MMKYIIISFFLYCFNQNLMCQIRVYWDSSFNVNSISLDSNFNLLSDTSRCIEIDRTDSMYLPLFNRVEKLLYDSLRYPMSGNCNVLFQIEGYLLFDLNGKFVGFISNRVDPYLSIDDQKDFELQIFELFRPFNIKEFMFQRKQRHLVYFIHLRFIHD